ncbi:MAG: sarcosine oxidase subunit alpha [Paraglaciecola sp.]|uniref:sarcosine oxidase subunit alpha n=2 Tax=Paraglaciecola sp. TaxID=1920173 RepID=UPI003263F299
MKQVNRLDDGGRINRQTPLNFTFNDKTYQGFEGDTLASALLANGVDVVGRSFKYSRPRGVITADAQEPNAIFQVGSNDASTIPNPRATQTELYANLVCSSTNGWPNVDFDLMGTVGKVGGSAMPPGFYYKTFMFPQSMWMSYEKMIRKGAGLGCSPLQPDPDSYDKLNHHCDVMVVGAGPAGLSAALAAARAGARVIIADEQNEMGGSLLCSTELIDGTAAAVWLVSTLTALAENDNVLLLPRSTAFGYYDQNYIGINERRSDHIGETNSHGTRQRLHKVRAKQVILATGAHERPLVFGNNDVPGCMLASAVTTYINRYAVVPGNRLALMTTNDNAYKAAIAWHDAGKSVVLIADTRPSADGFLVKEAMKRGIKVEFGHGIIDVKGSKRVKSVEVAPLSADGKSVSGQAVSYICDTVASSGGWSPVLHLSSHTGSKPIWRDDIQGFVPGNTEQAQHICGGIQGVYDLSQVLEDGIKCGLAAAGDAGKHVSSLEFLAPTVTKYTETPAMALFHIPHSKPTSRAPKQFVDYQNDVTAAGIELANREGFESIEHVKRYTALGFGTDQGKLGNINGMAITANSLGKTIPETGTTIFRPMYTPVTFGALSGSDVKQLFDPARFTAMHSWHVDNCAEFEDVGQWKRPWYYPKPGETMEQALARECLATRNSVGLLDASTLGKIDIQGKDAREFLNRVYTNPWSQLAVGKCRYGVMCKEDGMVFDDGVTACINDNRFQMTTTTGGAAGVLNWLELWHQTEWPELEVYFSTVTDHWSTMTISGPNSRKVLEKLTDADVSNEAFPYMGWIAAEVAGVKARIFRISFTGELSFEINVQANFGLHCWEAVVAAGQEFDITPYGTETMHILRAEKGFIIVGQDTDGSVTPQDLDMNWVVGKKKAFSYLGKRSWSREDNERTDRKQFVGLKPKDPKVVLPEGAQIVFDKDQPIPMTMVGHVTSSYYSACLGYSFALAVVKGGLERMGQSVFVPLADGSTIEAEICSSVFYDPKGDRQNV